MVVRTQPLDVSVNVPFVFQLLEFFAVKQPLNLKALQEMVLEKVGATVGASELVIHLYVLVFWFIHSFVHCFVVIRCWSLLLPLPHAPIPSLAHAHILTLSSACSLRPPTLSRMLPYILTLRSHKYPQVGVLQQQSTAQLQDALRDSAHIQLDVILQIGEVLIPQDPRDRTKPMILVDLGIVTASMGGPDSALMYKFTPNNAEQAYQQISASATNLFLDVLPSCDRSIRTSHHVLDEINVGLDILLAVGIALPELSNVILGIDLGNISANISPFDMQNLLDTLLSLVCCIPNKYLAPDKEIVARRNRRAVATSSAKSKFANLTPRQRIHELEVEGLALSDRALKLLNDDKILTLDLKVNKAELALVENDRPDATGPPVRMFLASLNTVNVHVEPRYSNIDLSLFVGSLVLQQQLAEDNTLTILSMVDVTDGNLFDFELHIVQPAAENFADAEADIVVSLNLKALKLVFSRPAFAKLIPFFIENLPMQNLERLLKKLEVSKGISNVKPLRADKKAGGQQLYKKGRNNSRPVSVQIKPNSASKKAQLAARTLHQVDSVKKIALHTDVAGVQLELFVEEAQKNLGVVNVSGLHFSLVDHTTRLDIGGHLDGIRIRDCSLGTIIRGWLWVLGVGRRVVKDHIFVARLVEQVWQSLEH